MDSANFTFPPGFDINKPFDYCTELTSFCRIELTTLGYRPSLGFNYFFAVAFFLAGLANITLGIFTRKRKRTWSYTLFITTGCFLETAGYAGRVALAYNPWHRDSFTISLVAIILAPTVICVSIYLTLKHVCLALGPSVSRIRPRWYPFLFVPADLTCLVLQAIGGGVAASSGNDFAMLQKGNRIIIAGIVLQVVVLLVFGTVAGDYYVRVRGSSRTSHGDEENGNVNTELWRDKRFHMFVCAVMGAYSAILIRCIYRIAEMAGGWANPIMRDEPSFIALESFMILIACVILAVFPAGILFSQIGGREVLHVHERQRNGQGQKGGNGEGANG